MHRDLRNDQISPGIDELDWVLGRLMHRSPGSRLFDPGPDATDEVRLITVDRPGYGGTHPVAEPSFAAVAQDLSALAEALG
jgi:pimeloyl-ACP methyl ester carboxylesterase